MVDGIAASHHPDSSKTLRGYRSPRQLACSHPSSGLDNGCSPYRSRGRQGDGERVAAKHDQGDQPPDSLLTVGIGPEQFRHIPDRCRLRLELLALGADGSPLRLEIGERGPLALTLVMSETGVSRGVRHQCPSPALLTRGRCPGLRPVGPLSGANPPRRLRCRLGSL
jgi:hypothetical protein